MSQISGDFAVCERCGLSGFLTTMTRVDEQYRCRDETFCQKVTGSIAPPEQVPPEASAGYLQAPTENQFRSSYARRQPGPASGRNQFRTSSARRELDCAGQSPVETSALLQQDMLRESLRRSQDCERYIPLVPITIGVCCACVIVGLTFWWAFLR